MPHGDANWWQRRLAAWREEEIDAAREGDLRVAEIYRDARESFLEAWPKWNEGKELNASLL
jgi:hypothetical protein